MHPLWRPGQIRPSGEDDGYTLEAGDDELVRAFRFDRYLELGFDLRQAYALSDAQVDWHVVAGLRERGCEPGVAVRIMV